MYRVYRGLCEAHAVRLNTYIHFHMRPFNSLIDTQLVQTRHANNFEMNSNLYYFSPSKSDFRLANIALIMILFCCT